MTVEIVGVADPDKEPAIAVRTWELVILAKPWLLWMVSMKSVVARVEAGAWKLGTTTKI